MSVTPAELAVGAEIPPQSFRLDRSNMVRYAGASGDFNPIHWDEVFARQVGLPDVIAHGMLTMGLAVRTVTDWLGDPGGVLDYGVRFTRPVVVPTGAAVELAVSGRIRSVDPGAGTAVVDLTATVNSETVLTRARVTVRLKEGN